MQRERLSKKTVLNRKKNSKVTLDEVVLRCFLSQIENKNFDNYEDVKLDEFKLYVSQLDISNAKKESLNQKIDTIQEANSYIRPIQEGKNACFYIDGKNEEFDSTLKKLHKIRNQISDLKIGDKNKDLYSKIGNIQILCYFQKNSFIKKRITFSKFFKMCSFIYFAGISQIYFFRRFNLSKPKIVRM